MSAEKLPTPAPAATLEQRAFANIPSIAGVPTIKLLLHGLIEGGQVETPNPTRQQISTGIYTAEQAQATALELIRLLSLSMTSTQFRDILQWTAIEAARVVGEQKALLRSTTADLAHTYRLMARRDSSLPPLNAIDIEEACDMAEVEEATAEHTRAAAGNDANLHPYREQARK